MYRFYLELYSCTTRFPKKDRYTLGLKCENTALEILELFFVTNAQRDQCKLTPLQQTDLKLKMLMMFVRLAYDTKTVYQKQYIRLQERLHEIGRMLGGWLKSLRRPE